MYLSAVQTNTMLSTTLKNARHGSPSGNGGGGCIVTIERPSPGSFVMDKRYKHGLSKHPLHGRWSDIKIRCTAEHNPGYKNYGGRGIIMCGKWINDFKAFYDYVVSLPNAMKHGYSIDRIDNDGNYEPGNIRWANRHLQKTNQRKYSNNTSGYIGVFWYRKYNKWQAQISVNGKQINLGYSNTISEAVELRNKYIIDNGLTEYKLQTT